MVEARSVNVKNTTARRSYLGAFRLFIVVLALNLTKHAQIELSRPARTSINKQAVDTRNNVVHTIGGFVLLTYLRTY